MPIGLVPITILPLFAFTKKGHTSRTILYVESKLDAMVHRHTSSLVSSR